MKIFVVAAILTIGLSGCWSDEQEKKSAEFMSNLATCDNCKLTKPFLGGSEDARER